MPQTKGKVGDDKLVSWIDQKQKASLFIRCAVKPRTSTSVQGYKADRR
jgi:hypothetical protein